MGKIINEKYLGALSLFLCCVMAYCSKYLYYLIITGEISLFMVLLILLPWVAIFIASIKSLFTKKSGRIINLVAFALALITTAWPLYPIFLHPLIIFFVSIGWLLFVIKSEYLQSERLFSSCVECGNVINCENETCPDCGRMVRPLKINHSDIASFIVKNADNYINIFQSFENKDGSFSVSWHWPAFFFTFWWFLYRKLYIWILLWLILIPFAFLGNPFLPFLIPVGFGMTANYIYYKSIRKHIIQSKLNVIASDNITVDVAAKGGVNKWVIPVGVIISLLLSALTIPLIL